MLGGIRYRTLPGAVCKLNQVTSLCGRLNNLQAFYFQLFKPFCQLLEVRWGPRPYNLLIFSFSVFNCLFSHETPGSTQLRSVRSEDSPPKSIVRTTKRLMLNIPRTTPRLAKRKLWPCGQQPTWWLPLTSTSAVASARDLLDLLGDLPGVPPPPLRPPPDLLLWLLRDLLLLWRPPLPAARRLL